jgi:hypothetical protein
MSVIAAFVCLACGTAQAKDLRISLKPDADDKLIFIDGMPAVVSTAAGSIVTLVPEAENFNEKKPLRFGIGIVNTSGAPVTMLNASVSASTDTGAVVILTASDYEARVRKEIKDQITAAKWMAVAAALNGASASMAAAQPASYSSTTTYGAYSATTYGTYRPAPNTVGQQILAQRQMEQAGAAIADGRATIDQAASDARSLGFNQATIEPGQDYRTPLPIEGVTRKDAGVTLVVDVGSDRHTFVVQSQLVK